MMTFNTVERKQKNQQTLQVIRFVHSVPQSLLVRYYKKAQRNNVDIKIQENKLGWH
uniref:Uncharacterized protein n=1 Tax=Helianthus annuus TaxID=4232 RepID=A0A251TCP8_HELAN